MSIIKYLLAAVFVLPATSIAAETTSQPIKQFRYDGGSNILYVVGPNRWGTTGCSNAMYVMIKPTLLGHKQMFVAIAAAHASGKIVKFFGSCLDTDYFDATYVIVE